MSETKFTPGPWAVNVVTTTTENCSGQIVQRGGIAYIKADTGHEEVAVLYSEKNQSANAHLIAAAPELYESLREMFIAFNLAIIHAQISPGTENSDIANRAERALAKARGEQP